jgi:FKBP-type peptidyl-prolyl cis-trans isomerase FkpA
MFKKLAIAALAASVMACNSGKVEVVDGLKLQFHKDEAGKTGKVGDILTMNLEIRNAKDSIVKSSYKEGQPIITPIQKGQFKGSFEDGMLKLSKGDSVTFFISVDSLFKGAPEGSMPPFFKKGEDIKFIVKAISVESPEEAEKTRKANAAAQIKKDADTIKSTIAKLKLSNVQTTQSGLNYAITSPGSGPAIAQGDSATVKYRGTLANGTEFDKGTFPLRVGMGQVIPGWDEGLQKFKQGDKGTLLIPSGLGYGERGSGPKLPPNSVLIFDIEIVKVKKN